MRLRLVLFVVAPLGCPPAASAQEAVAAAGGRGEHLVFRDPSIGPGDVYANIPARDDRGRDQIPMFRAWNPDPVGRHAANLAALNPVLARVVRKAQADNPGLRFVIGSGVRDGALQRQAVAWGWSKSRASPHQTGDAVDLWPLDALGRVSFDRRLQEQVGAAMKKAAAELRVPLRWGGGFQSFKDRDRSHFELVFR